MAEFFGEHHWVGKSLQDAIGDMLNGPGSTLTTQQKYDVEVAVEMAIDVASTKELPEGMTTEDAAVITLFTFDISPREACISSMTNSALRNHFNGIANPENIKSFGPYLYLLTQSLAKLQPLSSRVVYKGVHFDLSGNEEYSPGMTATWPAVTSCSNNLAVLELQLRMGGGAEGFTLFVIELTSDRSKCISSLSCFPKEDEVLVPPYTVFRTSSVMKMPVEGVCVIHLQEIACELV